MFELLEGQTQASQIRSVAALGVQPMTEGALLLVPSIFSSCNIAGWRVLPLADAWAPARVQSAGSIAAQRSDPRHRNQCSSE
jgi:hypothetical protein